MDSRLRKGLFGRRQIYTNVDVITNNNIENVLSKAMYIHNQNKLEIEYLTKYHKGNQPILRRVKEVRPEINHKIVENHAAEIVEFKTGYVFGSPIMLVQRGRCDNHLDNHEDDTRIATLNEMYHEESKQSKDLKLGRMMSIAGVGYRMIYPKKHQDVLSPFDVLNLDPTTTFIIRSNDIYKRPVLGITYVKDCYGTKLNAFAYSRSAIWELEGGISSGFHIIKAGVPNPLKMIPIIEYANNEDYMGDFEWVLPLLDALNVGLSDRLNAISQHVQALLWLNNAEIDEEKYNKLRQEGVIQTKSGNGVQASIKYLEAVLNQSETQTLVDYIYDTVRAISGIPDRKISTGGSTGQAIQLSAGWETAESMAKATELQFMESQREELKVVLRILRDMPDDNQNLSDLALSDIDLKFSRSKNDNALVKGQNLLNQLEAGVDPRVAIKECGLYSDAEQVYQDSRAGGYLEKWRNKRETQANNQPWGTEGGG